MYTSFNYAVSEEPEALISKIVAWDKSSEHHRCRGKVIYTLLKNYSNVLVNKLPINSG